MGTAPNWDLDLAFGEAGEARVANILGLNGSRVEVKTDRLYTETPRVFVEVAQMPTGHDKFKDSGLLTTQADYWVFNVGALVIIPTDVLRGCVATRMAEGDKPQAGGTAGDNPTLGYCLPLQWVIETAARWSA